MLEVLHDFSEILSAFDEFSLNLFPLAMTRHW